MKQYECDLCGYVYDEAAGEMPGLGAMPSSPITINLDRKAGQPVRLSLHLVPKLQ